jgi:hypothetical protein
MYTYICVYIYRERVYVTKDISTYIYRVMVSGV